MKWNSGIKEKLSIILLLAGLSGMHAQEAISSSGGNTTGAGGSLSFTIGQTDYISVEQGAIMINQGVQQPFEIVTLSGEEFNEIKLTASVYPNPTTNQLVISLQNYDYSKLSYHLVDIRGRSILEGKINGTETILNMLPYATSTYLLKLTSNNKEIKTFKIIKRD
jgi:hypothetical protein